MQPDHFQKLVAEVWLRIAMQRNSVPIKSLNFLI